MAKGKKKKSSRLDPTLSRGIIAVLLIILAIIITLSLFEKAGFVGVMINIILSFLFGSITKFSVPIIILIISWFLINDGKYDYKPTHIIGSLLFLISFSSISHLKFDTSEMFYQALNGHGGGVFGMMAWPMKEYLKSIASYVIFFGVGLISVFLIFNTTLTAFVLIHQKIFEGLGWLGRSILFVIKKLFVPSGHKSEVKIRGEYETEDDEYEDDDEDYEDEDEEEETQKHGRRFLSKRIQKQEEDIEEDDDEDEDDTKEIPKFKEKEEKKNDVWSKRVIIKNLPPLSLLTTKKGKPTSGDIKSNAEIIHSTLNEFNVGVTMGEVRVGPTVTQYSLKPDKGVKLSKITSLSNDLALTLAAHPIRIEAPIPGQSLVGIEVPNEKSAIVSFRELLEAKEFEKRPHNMMVALGKDVGGKTWFADLPKMPHLLIAGATGSGKTVCMNTIIMSLLYQNTAETLRMIMVDPKRVELTLYNGIPHLLTPVITNTQQTVNALKWCIGEMDRRFEVLSKVGSRDITSYNEAFKANKMPQIVFIIDELADLMATAAGEVEAGIIRLAQMARAVGIHLIVATQRPSVDVITGLMKANIPGRIAFSVASLVDSRTILDSSGAEKLIGRGDMLFQTAEFGKPIRIQGAYISESELKNVVKYLKGDEEPEYDISIIESKKGGSNGTMNMFGGTADDQDPLFEECKEIIIKYEKASASFLQRRLKIGYARAARILDELEEAGIVGPSQGAKAREILVTAETVGRTRVAGGEHNVFTDPEDEDVEEKDEVEEEENTEEDYEEDETEEETEDQYADVDIDEEEEDETDDEEEDDSTEEEIDDDHTHNGRSRFEY
ncbi:MAG: cell division protein FtsK [Candidatus Magasanikbacteria bacterium CG_4_10_14_0_2_um_filter_33_14]|uniref:Cell division protein FtsK n=1 Tax=Candidatus Magasanikbacteria bacterium CG_4_10_14_0_2_um_filter_33_14 TaxID=1974636 RepID=A0A2M7VAE6_9BACT|nr:MAG: cell division protein FtsK [Candidatus Magasanikbacteria bacterium CG_4_10_14_0_2_um_filter_33_14]